MELTMNYWAVLLAAVSSFVIGGIWYSGLFAKQWQQLVGLSDEEVRSGTTKVFLGSFILSLVIAFNLEAFIGSDATLGFATGAGFAAGLGWVAMALGINYLFERKPFALFLINGGYNVVAFTVMGLILGWL